MEPMEGVGMEIGIEKAGTPDVTDNDHLMSPKTHVLETPVKGLSDSLMRATRTKNRGPAFIQETRHGL
jgi:hypothetical protein